MATTPVDAQPAPAAERKIIFYSTIGPDRNDAAWTPFRLARVAAEADLDVEIFLSGPATGLMRRHVRDGLEGRPQESLKFVLDAGVPIRVSPG